MRSISFRFFLILAFCKSAPVFAQSNIDVIHYKFEIVLSDQSDTIRGTTTVTVQFTEPASSFWLSLASPNGKGKGLIAYRVDEDGRATGSVHGFDSLRIHLRKPAQEGETKSFVIHYAGIPYDGMIISKNKYGDRTFFADNWPNRAHDWIPCKDEPDDKASFEFLVTAPGEYRVVSNGKLQEEKMLGNGMKFTHWVEDVSLPTKVMVIGAAKFAVKDYVDSPDGIPVSAWTYPQDSTTGFRNYAVAPGIIRFFSNYIAPYPYNKLANVQSKTIFGGMENASSIFYYEESAESNRSMEDLLAHEIAHQWFGDMASEKSFPHLWLSEGFATYMTDIYLESKYGTDSMNNRLKEERKAVVEFAEHSSRPVVDSVSGLMNLLNANSYQKGAWILHMLRRQMGDELFKEFLKTYYNQYKGGNADTDDLEKIAEKISKKDLGSFFHQWLYSPGIPQLNIRWTYNETEKKISVTVDQLQKGNLFRFPLDLRLEGEGTPTMLSLDIGRSTETFTIPSGRVITNVIPDPDTRLLFDGKVEKINP